MSRGRAPALAAALLLAGCGQSSADATEARDDEDVIACALAGSGSFARDCTVERASVDGALVLVVRHPDGGFRRFEVLTGGRGLAVADGAEYADIVLGEGRIDVTVGVDRYRFPATIGEAPGGDAIR